MTPSPSTLLTFVALLVASAYALRTLLLPWLIRSTTHLRIHTISLRSIRGIEYGAKGRPVLRVERVGLGWARCGAADGEKGAIATLRVEGMTVRVERGDDDKDERPTRDARATARRDRRRSDDASSRRRYGSADGLPKPPRHWLSRQARSWALFLARLVVQHSPWLARIVDVELVDCAVVFVPSDGEDAEEITLRMASVRLGVGITFDAPPAEAREQAPSLAAALGACPSPLGVASPLGSPSPLGRNSLPLASPFSDSRSLLSASPFSPPISPSPEYATDDNSFLRAPSHLGIGSTPGSPRASRIRLARARASRLSSVMSSRAGRVWARALGKARGRASVSVQLQGVVVHRSTSGSGTQTPTSAHPSKGDTLPEHPAGTRNRQRSGSTASTTSIGPVSPDSTTFSFLRKRRMTTAPRPESILAEAPAGARATLSAGFGGVTMYGDEDSVEVQAHVERVVLWSERWLDVVAKRGHHGQAKTSAAAPHEEHRRKGGAIKAALLRALRTASLRVGELAIRHTFAGSTGDAAAGTDSPGLDLVLDDLSVGLASATPQNNPDMRDIFGTCTAPHRLERGIMPSASFAALRIEERGNRAVKSRPLVLAIGPAHAQVVSTRATDACVSADKLFVHDPNYTWLLARVNVGDIECRVTPQLLEQVRQERSRWALPPARQRSAPALPPRLRSIPRISGSFSLGDVVATVEVPQPAGTVKLVLQLAGAGASGTSYYHDVSARRRDRLTAKKALKEEEALQDRRSKIGHELWLPDAVTSKSLKRQWPVSSGVLYDDATSGLTMSCGYRLGDIDISLDTSAGQTRELLVSDAYNGSAEFTVLGEEIATKEAEQTQLDVTTIGGNVALANSGRTVLSLWRPDVQEALGQVVEAFRFESAESQPPKPLHLARLPSGLNTTVSLGTVAVVLASEDPNPACKPVVNRGLRFQSDVSLHYCFYRYPSQARQGRHHLYSADRTKLGLQEDAATQALGVANALDLDKQVAAIASVLLERTLVEPVYDADREDGSARPSSVPPTPLYPSRRREIRQLGWDFQRKRDYPAPESRFANAIKPLNLSRKGEAKQPLLLLPKATVSVTLHQDAEGGAINKQISTRLTKPSLNGDLSHVYCVLLAMAKIKQMTSQHRRGKMRQAAEQPAASQTAIEVRCDSFQCFLVLPLGEELFARMHTAHFSTSHAGTSVGSESAIAYVPSARSPGQWEEFFRTKGLLVKVDPASPDKEIKVSSAALRIRIPFAYEISKLILNFNVAAKSIKLLRGNLASGHFETVRKPSAEEPKRVPNISINVATVSLDIKDDPLETRLNLIWRVGLLEQAERLEREAMFENKVKAIRAAESSKVPMTSEQLKEMYTLDARHTVDIEDGRRRLDLYNSDFWIGRFRTALGEQCRREGDHISRAFGSRGIDEDLPIDVMPPERSAPLFRAQVQGFGVQLRRPELDRRGVVQHMEALAGPFPEGQQFSLMVPVDLNITAASINCSLRDYPLPLWRVAPVEQPKRGTLPTKPAFILDARLVIAEELPDRDDTYYLIAAPVLPAGMGNNQSPALSLQVAKTIMPVKTYMEPNIQLKTSSPVDFTWGNSMQPAISDLTRVFETFTIPPRDPSPKMGFWDKMRLILHWRLSFDFAGPVHLHLKGSRDPYQITEEGAGLVLQWDGGVRLRIGHKNPQYELIQFTSERLYLAVPDLSAYIDTAATGSASNQPPDSDKQHLPGLLDRRGNKTCASWVGGVRVGFGFRFERTCRPHSCVQGCKTEEDGGSGYICRLWEFKQHHEVILRTPEVVRADSKRLGRVVDSFEGFRSDYVHFSPSLTTLSQNADKGESSSFHFSPKGFAHFFAWWRLFSHVMSLPIRQGKLFPMSPPPSKKFGRSLATIKYRFDIAPLYISHIYMDEHVEAASAGRRQEAFGMKFKIDRFQADLHQREQKKLSINEKLHRETIVTHKPFYAAEVLLQNVSARAITAVFAKTPLGSDSDSTESSADMDQPAGLRVSALTRADHAWYNADDYVDVDSKPEDHDPWIDMHEIGECPLFRYSRWSPAQRMTSQGVDVLRHAKTKRTGLEASRFGKEMSHFCLLGDSEGVVHVQKKLVNERIDALRHSMAKAADEAEKSSLNRKIKLLDDHIAAIQALNEHPMYGIDEEADIGDHDRRTNMSAAEGANFENVYHVHNPQASLGNESRNIVAKYLVLHKRRRGTQYHMSNSALVEMHNQLSQPPRRRDAQQLSPPPQIKEGTLGEKVASTFTDALMRKGVELLLGRVDSLDQQDGDGSSQGGSIAADGRGMQSIDPHKGLPDDYLVQKSHLLLLLKPQIALRSQLDPDAVMLLSAEAAAFRGFTILDAEKTGDAINSHVMHRNYALLRGLQSFHPAHKLHVMPGVKFLPLEVLLDSKGGSSEFDRVISRTNAALHYDKFNHLRLRNAMEGEAEGRSDHLRHHQDMALVDVPRFAVMADTNHYAALYNIVTDLILYKDPEQRHLTQRLDTYRYSLDRQAASTFVAEAADLQARVRGMRALVRSYEDHIDQLTPEGRLALIDTRQDIVEAMESLHLLFEAAALSNNKDKATAELKSSMRFEAHAGEVAWFMLGLDKNLIAKLTIKGTHFSWLSKSDGSTANSMTISDLQALNVNPDAVFPEMVARYGKPYSKADPKPFAQVDWSVLAPVGGISIIERFHLDLHDVRIQLEKKIGKQINEYVFQERLHKDKSQQVPSGKRTSIDAGNGSRAPSGISTPVIAHNSSSADPSLLESRLSLMTAEHGSSLGSSLRVPSRGGSMHRSDSGLISQHSASQASQTSSIVHRQRSNSALKEKAAADTEVIEMRNRASMNRTFVSIRVNSTSLMLSYKGDKAKSLTDLYDLKFTMPELVYDNRTWSFQDLVHHIKRDIIKSAWSQRGALIREVLRKGRNKIPSKSQSHPPVSPLAQLRAAAPHEPSSLRISSTTDREPPEIVASPPTPDVSLPDTDTFVDSPEDEGDEPPLDAIINAKDSEQVRGHRMGKFIKKLVHHQDNK